MGRGTDCKLSPIDGTGIEREGESAGAGYYKDRFYTYTYHYTLKYHHEAVVLLLNINTVEN